MRHRRVYRPRLLLIALGCGFAAGAMAQGSHSIYGIVDLYAGSIRGSSQSSRLDEGGHTASRLGFRGREDLGGGLNAHYTLEMGLGVDTGTIPLGGGFGRQAFVGLGSRAHGQVDLGLQYTPVFFQLLRTAAFGMNTNWAPIQVISRADSQGAAVAANAPALRLPNMLRYRYGTASSGLSLDMAFAPGEQSQSRGNMGSLAIAYQGGSYWLGLSTQRVRSGTGASAPGSTYIHALSGYWQPNALKLSLNYIITGSTAQGTLAARHLVAGLQYRWGPHALLAEVARRDVRHSPNDALIATLGYDYSLSKRTRLYGRLMHVNNKAGAAVSMATATVAGGSGDNVRGIAMGMMHSF